MAAGIEEELAELEDQLLAVRLRINGACAAHETLVLAPEHWRNQMRAAATDLSGERVWLEKIELRTRAEADLPAMAARDDALGGLLRAITGLEADDALLAEIGVAFADLKAKLPAELRHGDDPLIVDDLCTLREAVGEAKELLVARLLATGDDA